MIQNYYQKVISYYIQLILVLFIFASCSIAPEKPDVNSEKYKKGVSDFYISLAAIQSDKGLFAVEKMQQVSEIFPAEPAVWANLSVFAMRSGNFELATKHMSKALSRADTSSKIQFLAGILESRKGNIEASIKHLKKAAELDPTNSKVLFTLAEELERQDSKANAREVNKLLNRILEQDPNNLAVLLETVRTAVKWEDRPALKQALQNLEKQSSDWPDPIQKQFQNQKTAILKKQEKNITFELAFLRNSLNQLPHFQYDLQQVQLSPNQIGFLISRFLWLPNVDHQAEPLDEKLTFSASDGIQNEPVNLFKPIGLVDDEIKSTITVRGNNAIINNKLELNFPGSSESLPDHAVTTIDYNYDFRNDVAFAGEGGFKLYRQEEDSTFADVTSSLNLPPNILTDTYYGVWANDLDLDGDLDLLLALDNGPSRLLRNNSDGTFKVLRYFEESGTVRDFHWADFDLDGDADAVLLTKDGEIHFYRNKRSGKFQRDTSFAADQPVYAVNFGDINSNGVFEVISWQAGGIKSISYEVSTGKWHNETLISFDKSSQSISSNAQLFIADLDNNAALDLMISSKSTTKYWLSDQNIKLIPEAYKVSSKVYGLADFNNDMRLDLVGLSGKNRKTVLLNKGSKNYNARIIRPRASRSFGDHRINSFGIGGEVESRSGLQYSKQPIKRPWMHIGLGAYDEAEMVRISWPNGSVQAEFAELGYESKIMNEQILKGSCPWVLTYNGQKMEFVTDFLWRTALGLRINSQGDASVMHSIDWIKINEDQLKPRNGFYDIRITADLWESHFFDHISLMAVDHPKDTEVFVDERFTLPAPEQKLYPMKLVQPIVLATDQAKNDVTAMVQKKDGKYVDSFSLTSYQGIAEEHYLEVNLGERKSSDGKQWLIASGWIYPTDTSVNIAISQGDHPAPHGIRLEVPNGEGGWKVAHQNVGFPTGKSKTMLIDIEDIFEPGTERKLRLYTNMEIYWDQIQLGTQHSNPEFQTKKIAAESSELRYRGFSKLEQKGRFKPTIPNYQIISGTTPKWRDLEGFYTRFGDVLELMEQQDDRYVIMNAGDELRLKFPALEAPKKGWERDFVLIGDGWVKDGDYNTGFSKTLLPLPYHGLKDYSKAPGLLQDDPAYQKHKRDWVNYHTRYITSQNFNSAMLFDN